MKTWYQLLGPWQPDDVVQGCYISRPTGPCTFRILWSTLGSCDGNDAHYARLVYEQWKQETLREQAKLIVPSTL